MQVPAYIYNITLFFPFQKTVRALIFYESDVVCDGWNFKFLNQMHNATAEEVVQFWCILFRQVDIQ